MALLDASTPVPRGILVLKELVVMYFMYSSVKCLACHTGILAAATGDRSLQLSFRPFWPIRFCPSLLLFFSPVKQRSEE